jgi:hypothetical protein
MTDLELHDALFEALADDADPALVDALEAEAVDRSLAI